VAQVRFRNTEEAAKRDRLSKWVLIEAIAVDATNNDLPITSADSELAAKAGYGPIPRGWPRPSGASQTAGRPRALADPDRDCDSSQV